MSDNSSQNDPSMKEILGSIRRIINEDNAQTETDGAAVGEEEETLELTDEVVVEEGEADRHEPTLTVASSATPEDAGEPEVRREPVLGLHSPAEAETAAEQPAAVSEEISETVSPEPPTLPSASRPIPISPEIVQDPEPVREDAPADVEIAMDQEISEVAESPLDEEPADQSAPADSEESIKEIVSETATTAAASALGELTRAMDEKTNKLKMGPGEITISDMVKELIRPMLREWLDENLPGIVERIVRREIQKLVDRAETDD